jgi:hypothetical protein
MPPIVIVLVIVAAVAATVVTAVWIQRLKDKRRKELAEWAQANGLKFLPDNDYSIGFRYQLFRCLQRGDNRYGYNIMVGTASQRVTCGFDYHYETHPADGKDLRQIHHHRFSAIVVDAGLPLKPLFIRPQGLFDKVTDFVRLDDIDFESAEFSRKFFVKSSDRRWAYDVLHQKTIELMLACPRFHIDFQGTQVVAFSGRGEFSLGEFGSALKLVTGILDNLPESVVRELKGIDSGARPS